MCSLFSLDSSKFKYIYIPIEYLQNHFKVIVLRLVDPSTNVLYILIELFCYDLYLFYFLHNEKYHKRPSFGNIGT